MRIPIIALRVLDQDRALKFYTETLGFSVTEDMDFGGQMRWITVSPPGAPEQEVLLERVGPPIVDQDTADQIDALIARGVGGTLFLQVDDCRRTCDELVANTVLLYEEARQTRLATKDSKGWIYTRSGAVKVPGKTASGYCLIVPPNYVSTGLPDYPIISRGQPLCKNDIQ